MTNFIQFIPTTKLIYFVIHGYIEIEFRVLIDQVISPETYVYRANDSGLPWNIYSRDGNEYIYATVKQVKNYCGVISKPPKITTKMKSVPRYKQKYSDGLCYDYRPKLTWSQNYNKFNKSC